MKLLYSSPDFADLGRLVKRLVWARIPCAVCKDALSSHLSVWIQQDIDFPSALHVFADRDTPRHLPHWARALDSALPATKPSASPAINGIELLSAPLAQTTRPTWRGTAYETVRRYLPQKTRLARPAYWPLHSVYAFSNPSVHDADLACADST